MKQAVKNCHNCAMKSYCGYLKTFAIDENIGCLEWRDKETKTWINDKVEVE